MSELYKVEPDGTVVVRTSSGWDVECKPVADLLLRAGQNVNLPIEPDIPTYTITGAGGATEDRPMDDAVAADPATSDEDRAAWAAYLEQKAQYDLDLAAAQQKQNEMRGRFMALRGIAVRGQWDDLEAWAAAQRDLFGFTIQDEGLPHADALRLAFIDNEVIRTESDGAAITAGIMRASGMNQEALDAIEETFRNSVAQKGWTDANTDPRVLAAQTSAQE